MNRLSEPSNLPPAVAEALTDPPDPTSRVVRASGYSWHLREWGDRAHRPLMLLHGVASNSETFWRIGPALAAEGWRTIAVDLPGHGETGGWRDRHLWAQTAADIAGLIRALHLESADLVVIGHSWGAMTAASLPGAGFLPQRLILIDPPAMTLAVVEAMLRDPTEHRYEEVGDAIAAVTASGVEWSEGDTRAKANALTQIDDRAVRAIYLENGDWDGGQAALSHPTALRVPTWIIRGDPEHGGLLGDEAVSRLVDRVGADRIISIRGAGHSPMRTHPEATVAAILRALER